MEKYILYVFILFQIILSICYVKASNFNMALYYLFSAGINVVVNYKI